MREVWVQLCRQHLRPQPSRFENDENPWHPWHSLAPGLQAVRLGAARSWWDGGGATVMKISFPFQVTLEEPEYYLVCSALRDAITEQRVKKPDNVDDIRNSLTRLARLEKLLHEVFSQ